MCVLGTNQNLNSESDFKLLHLRQENSSFCSPVSAGIEWWIWILSASKSSSEKFREQRRGLGRWVSYQHACCVNMRTWIWTEGMAMYTCNPSSEGGSQGDPWGLLVHCLAGLVSSRLRERPILKQTKWKDVKEDAWHWLLVPTWMYAHMCVPPATHKHTWTCVHSKITNTHKGKEKVRETIYHTT